MGNLLYTYVEIYHVITNNGNTDKKMKHFVQKISAQEFGSINMKRIDDLKYSEMITFNRDLRTIIS